MKVQHSILIMVLSILIGCASKPIVEIEIANAIFIDAESLEYRNIYLNIRNQTDIQGIERTIFSETRTLLEEKGFEVRKKPSEADFYLQAIILNIKREEKNMTLKEAFATTAITTGTGTVIGAVAGGGRGAGIGAGVGAGVGILGLALSHAAQPGYWYGLVEVEISEPQQKKSKSTQKVVRKKTTNKESSSDSIDGVEEISIESTREHDIVSSEEEDIIFVESGKKKTRTKMMIRVQGNLTAQEAGGVIKEALAHRLANFF